MRKKEAREIKPVYHPQCKPFLDTADGRETHSSHFWAYGMGQGYDCRSWKSMVRNWSWRPSYQDLGFGIGRAKAFAYGSYLDYPWIGSIRPTPLPLLLCRGQNGQMLGSRNQQGDPTLPRPLLRCLLLSCPPYPRHSMYRRSRCQCASMGYADSSQHLCLDRTHQYRRRRQNAGGRSTNYFRRHGQYCQVSKF